MAQYQILARKPLGPSGTGPKIQGVEKQHRNAASGAWLQSDSQGIWIFKVGGGRSSLIRSTTGNTTPSSACTRRRDEFGTNGISSTQRLEQVRSRRWRHGGGGREVLGEEGAANAWRLGFWLDTASRGPTTIVTPKSQFRTCPSDQDSIGYPRMKASGESSTTKHRLLHASGPHPIPPPNASESYNQDLGLIHSTNGNHLESPNEGSSIDHQVTIHLHAQNITMFPTNETWYFTSQMLVSSSGDLILILTAQSTRNEFRIHSDY
ncbi:hypothetical protein F511_05548 [Dorcoceras hygrometricum]|uniref:Uncharacterized protein n=1 Tax=Dorcoceras hygrometricum TaxID=472368 RepID=A0A2Z7CLC0_9LAMI|nr:hypothetical protein F511_05548 [Dorcoceras hygrometricum]